MNNNDNSTTMYDLIPAAASLNKVPGFDPLKLMHTVETPGTGEKTMVLDLKYKKLWFRLAYPKGKIKLNRQKITEELAVFEALIYFDKNDTEPVSSCTIECTSDTPSYIQTAQNRAIDRALTDAGFGIQFVKTPISTKNSRIEQDINISSTPQGISPDTANELPIKKEAEIIEFKKDDVLSNTVKESRVDSTPKYTADMSVDEILSLMTYEDACDVVVDSGVCNGMTIAQVAEKRGPSLKFYVYGGYKGSNIVKAAAQIMLEAMKAKMAG